MRTDVKVPCGACGGDGYVVNFRASEMFRLILHHPWASTKDLARMMRISTTNAANVAALLLALELVERRGSGARYSPYEWKAKR